MNVKEKQALVAELADKLRGANAVYLTDFVGLNVKAITELRARLRAQGSQYLVVKNTLAERALEGLDLPDVAGFFKGPTGLVIVADDPVAPAKILTDFARENNQRPAVKVGIVERRALDAGEVQKLASLPPREQLLAQLAGALEAPIAQLAFALQAKLNEMAGLIEALRDSRSA